VTVDAGVRCIDPCSREYWSGAQLELVSKDPDWPGEPPRPDGEGWIWASSVIDILYRFTNLLPLGSGQRIWQVRAIDIEIVASANDAFRYGSVHEQLYSFGFHTGWGTMVHGYRRPGQGIGVDVEGRGGAWVRRIEPAPWLSESEFDDDDD
jgi:hypothetical protein